MVPAATIKCVSLSVGSVLPRAALLATTAGAGTAGALGTAESVNGFGSGVAEAMSVTVAGVVRPLIARMTTDAAMMARTAPLAGKIHQRR